MSFGSLVASTGKPRRFVRSAPSIGNSTPAPFEKTKRLRCDFSEDETLRDVGRSLLTPPDELVDSTRRGWGDLLAVSFLDVSTVPDEMDFTTNGQGLTLTGIEQGLLVSDGRVQYIGLVAVGDAGAPRMVDATGVALADFAQGAFPLLVGFSAQKDTDEGKSPPPPGEHFFPGLWPLSTGFLRR